MSNNKIKIISGGIQQQKAQSDLADYSIDLSKSNVFMNLLEHDQQEIALNELQYNLGPGNNDAQINYQQWVFSFEGGGNFKGKKISGLLMFPKDFPLSAPKFYFYPILINQCNSQVIQHLNIYGDNLLCIPLLTHWNKQTTTMEILQAIEHIFTNPNWGQGDAPANPSFGAKKEWEQNQIQLAQAQYLPNFEKD